MTSKFRADHVGSLLRPPELLEAREAHKQGRISAEQLREVEDSSILKALEVQRQAGVDVFTDGEYRRAVWYGPLSNGIDGFVDNAERVSSFRTLTGQRLWKGRGGELAEQTLAEVGEIGQVVGAKLRLVGRMTDGEAAFLRQHAPGPWKITMPGVYSRAGMWFQAGLTEQFYPTRQALVNELVGFMQAEVRQLIDEGVSYFQLDSLTYAMSAGGPSFLGTSVDDVIAADNAVIEVAKAGGATVGLHVCRGNNRSAWATEGSYEPTAEKAFNQLKVDRFLLEYDTERSGGFEPLRFMPKDKVVVLGLISSKEPELESLDALRRRIDEAARYVPIENLAISPQCGFASTAPGNLLTWDDQRRKLELVVETARNVWG